MKQKQTFTNVVWKEGNYFVAQCLNVDVSSFGTSYKEALKNLEEALALYLEDSPKIEIQSIEMPSIATTTLTQPRYA